VKKFQGGVNQVLAAELTAVLDGMALVLDFGSLGKQALAAFGAAAANDVCPVLGSHACTKSELTLAATLGWLISPLAHDVERCFL
jgi:hypothetical protein